MQKNRQTIVRCGCVKATSVLLNGNGNTVEIRLYIGSRIKEVHKGSQCATSGSSLARTLVQKVRHVLSGTCLIVSGLLLAHRARACATIQFSVVTAVYDLRMVSFFE